MAVGKNNSENIIADNFQQKQVGDKRISLFDSLLPLISSSQTDSTPTNMQANNTALQEIGKAFAEDEKNFEDIEDEVKKEIELKKQTRFGNAMARLGGGITLNEEQRKALSPTAREKYNATRLAARNRGIGEMLLLFSDALAGRDIIGRSMERQKARLPKEKKLTAAQQNLQAYFEIINNPNATEEEKRLAFSLISSVGKSPEQIEQSLKASLAKQVNPVTGRLLTKEEIEEQLKTFRELNQDTLNQDTIDNNLPSNDVYSFDEETAKILVDKYNKL